MFEGGQALLLAPGSSGTGRGGTAVCFAVESVDEAYRKRRLGIHLQRRAFRRADRPLCDGNDPEENIVALFDNSKGGLA